MKDVEDVRLLTRSCWCGSATAEEIGVFGPYEGRTFGLVRCERCGVLALDPQPDDAELLRHYSAEYYGSSRRKFVGVGAALVAWFQGERARLAARSTPAGGRVLDVGCGNGGFLLRMKRRGFRVEGTEWTAASATRVPAEAGVPVHVGDLLTLDLPERAFDLVTLWHVFEHLRRPDATLQRIARLLKPGASLLLSLPNAESIQAARFGTAWFHHDPPRHLFGFGPRSLGDLLRQTGFEVVSVGTFSLEQNPFGFVQSWLNARGHPRDRLYSLLKGVSREPLATRVTDLLLLYALAASALVVSTIESLRGRGATMTVHARVAAGG